MGNKNQPEFENAISAPTMFFDFYLLNIPVSENSDTIYPSETNTNQSDKSGYPIRIFQVGVFKIESTGFKGLKHGFNLPAIFVCSKGHGIRLK